MPRRIENYALIGNTRTAALVGRDGSIDWLCIPRFDSEACFSALLGGSENGRWLIEPEAIIHAVRRCYKGDSLVLETEFQTEFGMVSIADFMPIAKYSERVDLVRIVTGLHGRTRMHMELILRFDYGKTVPWVIRTAHGIRAIAGPNAIELRTPVKLQGRNFTTIAAFEIDANESLSFVLSWHPSNKRGPRAGNATRMQAESEAGWQERSSQYRGGGEWREPVLRSLITLKALTYAPTGGIVAAPTTSLPEQLGGPRNWDYRYCWLRDSTLTLYALLIYQETQAALRISTS